MAKLLKYQIEDFEALNSNFTTFDLTVEKSFLWKKYTETIQYCVPHNRNLRDYLDLWDYLIKTGKKIKL